jgi:chromate reductase, NAD(P)H dehydrogenase (quinone)
MKGELFLIDGMKKIFAISGSTGEDSTNHHLIKAIIELSSENFSVALYEGIENLPAFNPDMVDNAGTAVNHFRELIREADAILICTPEYAHGVPGALKNAIDWTVATADFSGKPTMLITASSYGQYGHKALLDTLGVIEAKNLDELQLLISFAKTKISRQNGITDSQTLTDVGISLKKLYGILIESKVGEL